MTATAIVLGYFVGVVLVVCLGLGVYRTIKEIYTTLKDI